MTAGIVAVDVGNSTVGLAMQDAVEMDTHFVPLQDEAWIQRCLEWVNSHTCSRGCAGTASAPVRWLIASVHSAATHKVVAALRQQPGHAVHRVTSADVPMRLRVDSPDRLGIDRLLAAYAASTMFDPPFAVVDVGSAITVDWVDREGTFCGGAILPGLTLQAQALHRWTDALPDLSDSLGSDELQLPGRNTENAIRGGILAGAAGAIRAIVGEYADSQSIPPPPVAVTGGQAALITPRLDQNYALLPNLVCRGLLELPRSKQQAETESRIH